MRTYEERIGAIDRAVAKKKKARLRRGIAITASVAVIAAACNLWLFVPYSTGGIDLSDYRDSPYYAVIEQLSTLNYGSAQKTNNFQQLSEYFSRDDLDINFDPPEDFAPSAPDSGESGGSYTEVTNNQTEGVIEGDLFKRTEDTLFYLGWSEGAYTVWWDESENGKDIISTEKESECVLRAYSVAGEESARLGEYTIRPEEGMTFRGYNGDREMFLSEDGSRVTVLVPSYDLESRTLYTMLAMYDVSDPANMTETARIYLSGNYLTARTKKDTLLVINNFSAYRPDFDRPESYLPAAGTRGDMQYVAADDIILPEHANQSRYTVLYLLEKDTLAFLDSAAFLSYSNEAYVSADNIFLTHEDTRRHEADPDDIYRLKYTYAVTEIACVQYSDDELALRGNLEVNGIVNDRFSMDEYEGVLRVFTTTRLYSLSYLINHPYDPFETFGEARCNLYCYDLKNFEEIASVVDFAPVGESVRSARFDGTHAYICTAIALNSLLDPVFDFDLSDYNDITWRDTGTISGFSLSLIRFTDDTLLGIGYGEWREHLKIELYRSEGERVISVAAYESEFTEFSEEFKAYFIDAENALIGLGIVRQTESGTSEQGFLLLRFDGYDLTECAFLPCEDSYDDLRAFVDAGTLYVVSSSDFITLPL